MAIPWQCTHCGANWAARTTPCTCGVGVPPGYQGPADLIDQAGLSGMARKPPEPPNDVLGHIFAAQPPVEVPDFQALLHAQQQETVALAQQLDKTRAETRQLMQGMQALLQPLLDWWQGHGRPVSFEQVIPVTVQALTDYHAVLMQHSRPGRAAAPHVTANATPTVANAEEMLVRALNELRQTLDLFNAKFSAPTEPFPTYVQTDAQVARMEREMQHAMNQRGEGWRG
jgi:uncharacterized protein YukE